MKVEVAVQGSHSLTVNMVSARGHKATSDDDHAGVQSSEAV